MFQLTEEEFENLKCNFFTSSWGGRRWIKDAYIMLKMNWKTADQFIERTARYDCPRQSQGLQCNSKVDSNEAKEVPMKNTHELVKEYYSAASTENDG